MQPNKFNKLGKKRSANAQKRIEIITEENIPLQTPFCASSFFFYPNFKIRNAYVPSPNISANAKQMTVIGNTTFVAPLPK